MTANMQGINVEGKSKRRREADDTDTDSLHVEAHINGGLTTTQAQPLSGSMYALDESSLYRDYKGKFILKEEKRRRKRLIGKTKILLILLLFFILVSLILTGILAWTLAKTYRGTPSSEKSVNVVKTCEFLPGPVAFTTLPSSIKDVLKKMEEFIVKEIDKGEARSLSANVVYMDRVIWEGGHGVVSTRDNRLPNSKTVYPCASLSKIFTSLMLFKLYDMGTISSLDVLLTKYEPEFAIRNPYHRNITLRDIATQRSGLQREAPCYPSSVTNFCPYNHSTMLQRISELTLLREPGEEPQYSNLGWSLLGQVLAKAFGHSDFDTWMRKNLLLPLGMNGSSFVLLETLRSSLPTTASFNLQMDWGWLAPSGGLYSSVHDLAQMELQLFSNNFISSDTTREFFKEDFVFPDGVTMTGAPWEIGFHKGRMIRGKTASVYGYTSYVAIVPEIKLAFNFICTDCLKMLDNSLQEYFKTIVTAVDEAIEQKSQKKFNLPKDVQPYLGTFSSDSNLPIQLHMKVRQTKNKLAITINSGQRDTFFLNYTEPLMFRLHLNPEHSCNQLFTFGVEGDTVLFDAPSLVDGLSEGFTMYSAHPSGRTYFSRES